MKFICTSVFILSAYFLFGQQETIFNHFWNNQTHFNPTFAGLEYRHQAGALYRSQWQNVNGAPEDIYGFYNARLIDHLGVGINFNYGTIGFRTSYNIAIPIAYHLQLNDNAELSLGVAIAFNNEGIDPNFIPPETFNDPNLQVSDEQHLLTNLGIAFKNENIRTGVSIRNLTLNQINGNDDFQLARHMYGMFQYRFDIPGWLPAPIAIYAEANFGTDFVFSTYQTNARVQYNNQYSLIAGYDFHNGPLFGLGYDLLEKFRLMYSATLVINQLSPITDFTHEFSLVYQLPFDHQKPIPLNP